MCIVGVGVVAGAGAELVAAELLLKVPTFNAPDATPGHVPVPANAANSVTDPDPDAPDAVNSFSNELNCDICVPSCTVVFPTVSGIVVVPVIVPDDISKSMLALFDE